MDSSRRSLIVPRRMWRAKPHVLCPHCCKPIVREPAAVLPFPVFIGLSAPAGATTTNYTTPGSYNYTVPNYNTMTVIVNGGGGGGGASEYSDKTTCSGPSCGGGG